MALGSVGRREVRGRCWPESRAVDLGRGAVSGPRPRFGGVLSTGIVKTRRMIEIKVDLIY